MKKLPPVKQAAASSARRQWLQQWLHEWTVDLALRGDGEEPPPDAVGRPPEAGPSAAPGQVRLLFPCTGPEGARLCYLAVLREVRPGHFLAAPFGRFSVPATPGEWRTPRAEAPLRVLELWNARVLSGAALAASWTVDELLPREREDALAVYQAWYARQAPPGEPDIRTGPPLIHPLDPRHEYMEEECAWMDGVAARFFSRAEKASAFPASAPDELPLAAEPRKPYRARRRKK
ncbi:MAG TPA: hypothetical protein P5567_02175 [Kiritimatiellia bacterium]|nr:hypothetical protein [Kiritimatiellia bacterium]HRZ11240.1 hypothetical protein [Kiritimatiellia bacterium]HSA19091.1 hypothetical protein [Kiritimatiellia bacterium]